MASTLLDAVRKPETAPASAARAHGYLCKPCRLRLCFVYISEKPSRGLPVYPFRNRAKLLVTVFMAFVRFLSHVTSFVSRVDDDRDVATDGAGNSNPALMAG